MKKVLIVLAVPLALVLVLLLFTFTALVLSFMPPFVTWISVGLMAVVACWFVFARGHSGPGANSESALMGRQNSKEGML